MQTQSAADYFKNLRNLLVIPNAVKKPSLQKITALDQEKHIVSVGRLYPFNGFDTLIHAFARLYLTHWHLRLTIYGEGPERENLQNLINSLNLKKTISLPGAT